MSNIRALFENAVNRTPDKVFLIFKKEEKTYKEFLESVNRVANGFLSLGVQKGDKIAILLNNCFEFPCSWLAANMIGAVMVPVNARFVAGEIEYILNHSEARVLVTADRYLEVIEDIQENLSHLENIINIDNSGRNDTISYSTLLDNPSDPKGVDIDQEDPAVILYTSGTTGNPKGCVASHDYFVHLAEVEARLFELKDKDRVLTAQPFYYMDPQWNTLMVMTCNATLVLAERFSTSKFWDEIREYDVTCFYCIGSMTSFLFNMPPSDLDKVHHLRLVQTSGISPHIHKEWEERFNVPVYEIYASTETTADIAVMPGTNRKVGTKCIGRPLWYRETKIVDDEDRLVPDGEVGEILVKRGRGMMLGYYKDPEATERAFRGGWFHSGDLAFMDKDGDYHFVGRKKDIIRRGGENISAAAVEHAIINHPKVMDAAVIPVPDKIRGEEVKAYVVLKEGEKATYEEIAEYCEENLGAFKVPRYYEFRDSLPKTPSERVQKKKLIEEQKDLTAGCYERSTNR
ncbi:MAG TPA: ATP-dependent acyl-CoA ligase [Alphaproteobacteria bacterium]|nr:ATP-dependent acyl-CoA ligase [Alphaproteobacteria bacterium]